MALYVLGCPQSRIHTRELAVREKGNGHEMAMAAQIPGARRARRGDGVRELSSIKTAVFAFKLLTIFFSAEILVECVCVV